MVDSLAGFLGKLGFKRNGSTTSIAGNPIREGRQISYDEYLRKRGTQLAIAAGFEYLYGEPDLLLIYKNIPIPIYSVQEMDFSISSDVLEFRSDGNVFMAQQKGGNFGARVRIYIEESFYASLLLWLLKVLVFTGRETSRLENPNTGESVHP